MAETTKVWRMQDSQQQGPYAGGRMLLKWPNDFHDIFSQHPLPIDDFGVFKGGELVDCYDLIREYEFAFPTEAAAYSWFNRDDVREMLEENGFKLEEVDASEVLVSDSGRQCMFKRAVPLPPRPSRPLRPPLPDVDADEGNDVIARTAKAAALARAAGARETTIKVTKLEWTVDDIKNSYDVLEIIMPFVSLNALL